MKRKKAIINYILKERKKKMRINELKGEALKNAIKEERETEWNGEIVSRQTIIDLAIMNQTEYDRKGHFVSYGKEN